MRNKSESYDSLCFIVLRCDDFQDFTMAYSKASTLSELFFRYPNLLVYEAIHTAGKMQPIGYGVRQLT